MNFMLKRRLQLMGLSIVFGMLLMLLLILIADLVTAPDRKVISDNDIVELTEGEKDVLVDYSAKDNNEWAGDVVIAKYDVGNHTLIRYQRADGSDFYILASKEKIRRILAEAKEVEIEEIVG